MVDHSRYLTNDPSRGTDNPLYIRLNPDWPPRNARIFITIERPFLDERAIDRVDFIRYRMTITNDRLTPGNRHCVSKAPQPHRSACGLPSRYYTHEHVKQQRDQPPSSRRVRNRRQQASLVRDGDSVHRIAARDGLPRAYWRHRLWLVR
ncbi:hypothetical protein F01_421137 [Burkholderia cenocepacia]|nr:hypothetical protein F01_421137 [Burkholderia cenocepacia]